MATATKSKNASVVEHYIPTYRWMLLARVLEEKLASLYRAGKIIGGVYVGRGQEAYSAALAVQLDRSQDVYAPLIRDMAGRFAFGESLLDPVRTYLGSADGPMRGRDGNVHFGRPKNGCLAMISHLGAMISVVNGTLMARRLQGKTGCVGAASVGEGATSTGAFHEALNQAAVEKLPLVLSVANNQFAYSTDNRHQFACEDLADRARGYGVQGHTCDGTNLRDCLSVFKKAVHQARNGGGPQLVIGKLLRLSGHGEHDDACYVPESLKKSKWGRDCIRLAENYLLKHDFATKSDCSGWRADAVTQVEQALETASQEAPPSAARETWHALATKHLCEGSQQEL